MTAVSIVIPVLNESANIHHTLSLLQPLRSTGHQLIVVDGGSKDDTLTLTRPLADKVLTTHSGRAYQMNTGARESSGEILLFLHADTELPSNADTLIIAALAGSRHQWGRFDVRFPERSLVFNSIAALMNLRSRLSGVATGDQAMFIRRELFEKVSGFAPIPLMEDVELSKRLKRFSPPACLRARVTTSSRRWRKHGVVKTVLQMWWLRLRFFIGTKPERLAAGYRPHHP